MGIQKGSGNFKNVADLPDDVLYSIFSWVTPKDIGSLSQTCHRFNKTIKENEDRLWARVCQNHFNIRISPVNGFARRFYKNVLHIYGHLLGLWIREDEMTFNDGLLYIMYRGGQLLGFDLQVLVPSANRSKSLHPKSLFRIYMDQENNDLAVIQCCLSPATSQFKMDLQYLFKQRPDHLFYASGESLMNLPKWYLVTNHIDMRAAWSSYRREQSQRITILLSENQLDVNDEHFHVSLSENGLVVKGYKMRYDDLTYPTYYSRPHLPPAPKFPVPIEPGLFTAISAWPDFDNQISLERQFALLSYYGQDGEENVTAVFLTRDVGEVCFRSNLRHCMGEHEGNQQQQNNEGSIYEVDWKLILPQPFHIPPILGNYAEKFPNLPGVCFAKFQGVGAILSGYSGDPDRITEGQWVVFNKNVFGFFVTHLEQPQMTLFHRVEYPLLQ